MFNRPTVSDYPEDEFGDTQHDVFGDIQHEEFTNILEDEESAENILEVLGLTPDLIINRLRRTLATQVADKLEKEDESSAITIKRLRENQDIQEVKRLQLEYGLNGYFTSTSLHHHISLLIPKYDSTAPFRSYLVDLIIDYLTEQSYLDKAIDAHGNYCYRPTSKNDES